jgi:hypothetical protein
LNSSDIIIRGIIRLRCKGRRRTEEMTNTLMIVVVIIASLSLSLSLGQQQQVAMAQQVSPAAQNIIDIVHSNCEQITTAMGMEVLSSDCVALKYETPNLVVLDAKMFLVDTTDTERFIENDLIWQALEAFIALHGYSVDSVVLSSAQRNEPNPDEFIVVMSKP